MSGFGKTFIERPSEKLDELRNSPSQRERSSVTPGAGPRGGQSLSLRRRYRRLQQQERASGEGSRAGLSCLVRGERGSLRAVAPVTPGPTEKAAQGDRTPGQESDVAVTPG